MNKFIESADAVGLGLSYDMPFDALSRVGGIIEARGRHPISDVLYKRKQKLLGGK